MGRRHSRRRSLMKALRVKPFYCILILTLLFSTTLTSFLITYYLNSNYVADLVTYILTGRRSQPQPNPIAEDQVKFYQPRQFSGKDLSVQFDANLKYEDFNYLQSDTLTSKTRVYTNASQIIFRMPTKKSTAALLLIFHSCNRMADDWFRSIERQRILGAAIDLGYGGLVFQATDAQTRCWSTDTDLDKNNDVQMVLNGLQGFYREHPKLGEYPLTNILSKRCASLSLQNLFHGTRSVNPAAACSPVSSSSISCTSYRGRFSSIQSFFPRSCTRMSRQETIRRRAGYMYVLLAIVSPRQRKHETLTCRLNPHVSSKVESLCLDAS